MRRLGRLPIVTVGAIRTGESPPSALARPMSERLERVDVGPLDIETMGALVADRLGRRPGRGRLEGLYTKTGGNPLFAIELARSERWDGAPESVEVAVRGRLERLTPGTRRALELAAVALEPTLSVLGRVTDPERDLRAAFDGGLLELVGERVRFSHPLLAAAVAATTNPIDATANHRRLAGAVTDPQSRAWHIALGHDEADESLAASVAAGATLARRRGASGEAGRLYEAAARLTPGADQRARRLLLAADCHYRAGDATLAMEFLRRLVDGEASGAVAGEAAWRLGIVIDERDGGEAAVPVLESALRLRGLAGDLRARLHTTLARTLLYVGRAELAEANARDAVRIAAGGATADTYAGALATSVWVEVVCGGPGRDDDLARAIQLQPGIPVSGRVDDSPLAVAADRLRFHWRFDDARVAYGQLLDLTTDSGDAAGRWYSLYGLANVELDAGHWRQAGIHTERVRREARDTGFNVLPTMYVSALLDAHLGRLDPAAVEASELLAAATSAGDARRQLGFARPRVRRPVDRAVGGGGGALRPGPCRRGRVRGALPPRRSLPGRRHRGVGQARSAR